MKKRAMISLAVSLLINLISLFVNLRAFHDTQYLRWSYKIHGGEITTELAFALRAVHTYAMTPMGAGDSHSLRFSPLSALALLIAWAVLIYGIMVFARRVHEIRKPGRSGF